MDKIKEEIYIGKDEEIKDRVFNIVFIVLLIIPRILYHIADLVVMGLPDNYWGIFPSGLYFKVMVGLLLYQLIRLGNRGIRVKEEMKELDEKYQYDDINGFKRSISYSEEDKVRSYIEEVNKYCNKQKVLSEERLEIERRGLTERDLDVAKGALEDLDKQIGVMRICYKNLGWEKTTYGLNEGIMVVEELRKDLEKDPKRIIEMSEVLNKYVPYLSEVMIKYSKVESHKLKDDYVKGVERKAVNTIKGLINKIEEDYELFKDKEVNDLKMSIKAVRSID